MSLFFSWIFLWQYHHHCCLHSNLTNFLYFVVSTNYHHHFQILDDHRSTNIFENYYFVHVTRFNKFFFLNQIHCCTSFSGIASFEAIMRFRALRISRSLNLSSNKFASFGNSLMETRAS